MKTFFSHLFQNIQIIGNELAKQKRK